MEVDVRDAKTQMDGWLELVAEGQEIVLLDAGKPVGKLVLYKREPRESGGWEGKVWIAPGIDEVDAEIARWFNESEIFPPEP